MGREIKLTQGKSTIVDEDIYDFLNQWKWCYHKGAAVRNASDGGKSKYILMHRLITNAPKDRVIDHADGNSLNNIRSNLRVCTQSENMMNRAKKHLSENLYKGIYFEKRRNKWVAQIASKKLKIKKYLGQFDTQEAAAFEYDKAALKYFGEFARINSDKGAVSV